MQVNYSISLIGAIITFFVGYYDLSRFDIDVKDFFTSGFRDQWVAGVVLISWFLILVVLPICIGFVQTVDNCCNFLCKCCSSKCFPVVQHSVLDVDNMDQIYLITFFLCCNVLYFFTMSNTQNIDKKTKNLLFAIIVCIGLKSMQWNV